MRSGLLTAFVLLAVSFICSDASALCAGGGFMGGGRSMGAGGVIGASGGGGGGGGVRKPEKKFVKWELPGAVEPAKLDTTRFDEAMSALSLTDEQRAKIEAAKKDIRDNSEQLAKTQNEARSAYSSSPGEVTCTMAARDVMQAASAIKSFDPKLKFESVLGIILTSDQRAKYRELMTKKT